MADLEARASEHTLLSVDNPTLTNAAGSGAARGATGSSSGDTLTHLPLQK